MNAIETGSVVLLKFPFSDGIEYKRRPALLLKEFPDGDVLVCRITSKIYGSKYDIFLDDWAKFGLKLPSVVRVHKMATIEASMIESIMGRIDGPVLEQIKAVYTKIIGTYIYTNWGNVESEQIDPDGDHTNPNAKAPILGANKKGAWKNGQVYNAPFWIGYRNGNQISRIGFSHSMVQNLTQNAVHKYLTPTPYFLNYDYFNSGLYFYSGYYNPFSLWEK